MSTINKKPVYTYADFAADIVKLCEGEIQLTPELVALMLPKAKSLAGQQEKKREYNATHTSTSKPKGASDVTKSRAASIAAVLTGEPMTAAEISAAIGEELSALQVSNAIKYSGVDYKSAKVIRDTIDNKGLRVQRQYTAYYI